MATVEQTYSHQHEDIEMNNVAKITAVSVIAVAGLAAVGATAGWGEGRGSCDRGGPGGPGAMMMHKGKGGRFADRQLDLTSDEARTLVEARLIMRGNDRLKVGQVSQKDDQTYLVDIVTVDDSLVRQVEIDRDNGLPFGRKGPRK